MNNIKKNWINIDPFSLQLRLTVGMASFSALVLGSLATWTSWKMQQILIDSRKHEVEQIAKRLPQDLQIYSRMMQPEMSLQKAINNFANTNTLIWFKNSNNEILSKTENLDLLPDSLVAKLMKLTQMPIKAQVYQIDPSYFVVCGTSIKVQGKLLGELFVVKDITREQTMFVAMVRNLGITSILAIIILTVAIAFYIRRSLQPLRQLSQMTAVISAEDLGQAQLYLDNAPSEVKELAQTLTMLLSRLAQSWEQEREFVSNVSHELRTPLTIVYGYLQSVLRRQNNLTPLQQEALEIAASEAERTIRLLQDLLDLARADSGYLYFQMKTYVLNDIVAEIVVMAEKYSDRLITIESTISPIEVKVDYSRFKQVLLNLIDNAVKYSEADTPITFKLDQLQDTAIIQVCDQGYGIPLQHQARIFERFYRIDESRSQATGGCGLGLSIVKTLVEGMGGSVSVQSKLGEGSIFTIILPR
ncbi:Periplasmic Sensor Signal Transduction Histidine Kinase [Trichormus variabilis ATCC 29413]|uniref:histidine kinase n=2 Tax=Anabaena variabilis TaxID=264691 RepID=Q3MFJ9_TRIV2|nr:MULTISPECIES: HAMP domain-containing sensor histidine kinase [Nostocaceae]ABA20237.1 Periplasmic Sensor Signal Transduction Histidine Kinase [Trichormus variabilis ATCC 29413]MBC1215091.1 HAMP domain-containing histidine kinase [Trichormus variabilis ARAD]MBC1258613.1 HAMP domain-containing histidine kinase [Trichormus variabilis V5]MBC1270360.1 HAMP domain-containing histidine kinase [Trichormus variabilis FSR]MBC1303371.1 HAMP domain-containing histidine kinase [Trichormus variabilis N2B]